MIDYVVPPRAVRRNQKQQRLVSVSDPAIVDDILSDGRRECYFFTVLFDIL